MRLLVLCAVFCLATCLALAEPAGTAFTYQGRVELGGEPVTGSLDMTFRLYDAPAGAGQVGSSVFVPNVQASQGVFTTTLDFQEELFGTELLWLEIQIGPDTLSPRQPIRPSPLSQATLAAPAPSFANVLYVSATGGEFDTIEAALGSLPVGGPANPTLVWVGPGAYTVEAALTVPPNTALQGAGIGVTTITRNFAVAGSRGIGISLQGSAKVRDLSLILSSSTASPVTGIQLNDPETSTLVERVDVTVSPSSSAETSYGVYVLAAGATLRDCRVGISGGNTEGIYVSGGGSFATQSYIERCRVSAGNCSGEEGIALRSESGSVNVTGSELCGGQTVVSADTLGVVQIADSRLQAGSGAGSFMFNATGAAVIRTATSGVFYEGNLRTGSTPEQSLRCVHCYNASFNERNSSCQ